VDASIWITSPNRERPGCTTATKHGKGQDEDHDLGSTVQSRGHDVVVLDEELGALLSQIPLSEEAKEIEDAEGGVDADEEEAHLPEDDGCVDVSECGMWVVAVGEPEGNWDGESDEICYRDPFILGTDRESFTCDTPSDGKCVELLDVLSAPDIGAGEALQDWSLIVNDPGAIALVV